MWQIEWIESAYEGGDKSCVKEILGDLWQRIDVTFIYEEAGKEARLVFPEHYEGSGGKYTGKNFVYTTSWNGQ